MWQSGDVISIASAEEVRSSPFGARTAMVVVWASSIAQNLSLEAAPLAAKKLFSVSATNPLSAAH